MRRAGERLGRNRLRPRMEGDIGNGGEREKAAASEKNHPSFSRKACGAGRPKPVHTPLGLVELLHNGQGGADDRGDNQLSNSRASAQFKGFAPEIREKHTDFPAIVGIDRSGRIQNGDAVLARPAQSAAAPGPRSRAESAGRFPSARDGGRRARSRSCCRRRWLRQVEAGCARALIGGHVQAGAMRQLANRNRDCRRLMHRNRPRAWLGAAFEAMRRNAR